MASQLLRRLLVDLLVWFLMPAVFMFVYVEHFDLSAKALLPHFKLAFIAWVALGVARLVPSWACRDESLSRLLASSIVATALLLLVSYYGAVIAGLASWGQVISWDLIRSYSIQLPALAGSLGIPLSLIVAVVLVVYVALFFGVSAFIRRFDWSALMVRKNSPWLLATLAGSCALIVSIEIAAFPHTHAGDDDEPVSLTLFPIENAKALQDHAIDRLGAKKLDALEDASRAAYKNLPATNPVNVVLIVVDALRPDHLGVYGYPRGTTPLLDQMARTEEMRVLHGVHASCTESSCGLLSLAASKYVHQFSERPITLHEILRSHGYKVHLILGGDHTNFYGLRAAYGVVDSYFDGSNAARKPFSYYANDDQFVVDRAAQLPIWDGQPAMLQFHLMSAHQLGKRHDDLIKYSPSSNYTLRFRKEGKRDEFINYYDNGVAQADTMISRVLGILREKHYLQKSLVIITADHGESLGEHGEYVHAHSVIESSLKIPLMFIFHGYMPAAPFRVDSASQVDIAPTILTELGIGVPSSWAGSPLQMPEKTPISYFQQKMELGLIDRRDAPRLWKYWINQRTNVEYTFDLSRDPNENSNLIAAIPQERKREWLSLLLKLRPTSVSAIEQIP